MRTIVGMIAVLLAGLALGAAGDAIYRVTESKEVTKAEVSCFATCAKNLNAWSGALGDVRSISVSRMLRGDGFHLSVTGTKTAPLSGIVGNGEVTVEGVVPSE